MKKKKYGKWILSGALACAACVMLIFGGMQIVNSREEEELPGAIDFAPTGTENGETPRKMKMPEELKEINEQIGTVSYRLFQKAVSEQTQSGKSGMISPMSLMTCLSMAQAGAEGRTKQEMEEAFGFTAEEYAKWLKNWYDSLPEDAETKMNVANSFWYREDFQVKDSYVKLLKVSYHSTAQASAFDDGAVVDINRWCNKNTFGMIPKILEEIDPEQEALLLNAVAFEGKWETPYEDLQIREEETFFTEDGKEEKVGMLYSTENRYLSGEHTTGFLKPYQDGYSFAAFLPDEGMTLSDWLKEIDEEEFGRMLKEAESKEVHAVIPEFKYEYTAKNMKSVLKDMGILSLFSEDCDLSGIGADGKGDGLYVSDVLHKTFIELNREGTRAAAVTGLIMKTTSIAPEEYYEVRLDRPFVYAIIDSESLTPIFMGTMMNPE